MKTRINRLALICIILTLVACAANQTLTPDQQARVALDRAQTQLSTWWDTAHAYYVTAPEKQDEWKTVVVPAFDAANKTLRAIAIQYQKGAVTPDQVQPLVTNAVNQIMSILVSKGVIK